jgi:hypothetical protein
MLGGGRNLIPKLDLVLKLTNPEDDYRVYLHDLLRRKARNIIIDLPPDETQVFLRMCLQLGMITSEFNYILTTFVCMLKNLWGDFSIKCVLYF